MSGLLMLSFAVVLLPPLFLFLSYSLFWRAKRHPGQYPPGPKPKPIIGNALDFRFNGKPWLHYLEWSKRLHSDIVHMSVFNTHTIVLHNLEDVIALLDKRSTIYSDRPVLPIVDLLGMGFFTSRTRYGDKWRYHRRIFQEVLRKNRVPSHHHIITEKVHLLLGELLSDPSNFSRHCKWVAASITFAMTFGYKVAPGQMNDRFIAAADFAGATFGNLVMPGRTIINVLPFFGRIPLWVPGTHTQRLAARVKEVMLQYKTDLFEYAKENMAQETSSKSIVATLLQISNGRNEDIWDEETLKDVMASGYFAGVSTVQNALVIFMLCVALHPESQRKAQMEIDRFVGTERLPTFGDRPSLPYVEALYREIRRWRPVVPFGGPHSVTRDDIYKGFYIPKGAIVMPNVWAITRDESRYRDPDHFMPERFFNADGTLNNDTVDYTFGFGRRICPGMYIADAEVWLAVACILATFKISKAKDDDGNEIDIDPNAFTPSAVSRPLPFKCSILPRFHEAEKNIRIANNANSDNP